MLSTTSTAPAAPSPGATSDWELRFEPLFAGHRGYAFPCDAHGEVDMDQLSERALQNYLYARAMMGRETAWPRVLPSLMH